MAMVRYQMFLEESQKRVLEEMHRRLDVPVAELIRRAIDAMIAEERTTSPHPEEQADPLLALIGVCAGGPSDLADHHDQYLCREERQ